MTNHTKKLDSSQNTRPVEPPPSISTKPNPNNKPSNSIVMASDMIKCMEDHHLSEPEYLPKDTKACKWGKKNGNVKTCGDCPFSIIILDYTPSYREYLDHWEKNLSSWHWPKEYSQLFHLNGFSAKKPPNHARKKT